MVQFTMFRGSKWVLCWHILNLIFCHTELSAFEAIIGSRKLPDLSAVKVVGTNRQLSEIPFTNQLHHIFWSKQVVFSSLRPRLGALDLSGTDFNLGRTILGVRMKKVFDFRRIESCYFTLTSIAQLIDWIKSDIDLR